MKRCMDYRRKTGDMMSSGVRKYQQFRVVSQGLFTTVQDSGRFRYQKYGVPVTGYLDGFSARMANILVGNDEDAAVLEFTLEGPQLQVLEDGCVAITGADMEVTLNGNILRGWQSFRVKPGDFLEIGKCHSGCRGYLAVTGGIDVPVVMGSRSTYVGAFIGGQEGRPLKSGDKLYRGIGSLLKEDRKLPREFIPPFLREIVLRAVPGPQDGFFAEGADVFFNAEFTVSSDANRMGYRLEGPKIVQKHGVPKSIISESSLPGGVQIPPNGQPIVLLVEQTVGGYSKIATVISSDLHLIAQATPGDKVFFERVSLEKAYEIKKNYHHYFNEMKRVVELSGEVQKLFKLNSSEKANQAMKKYCELYPEC